MTDPIELPEPEVGSLLRGPTKEEELASAQDTAKYLGYVEILETRWGRVAKPRPQRKSVLADDDRKTDPIQLSHLVTHAGNVGVDALRALRALLKVEQGRLTLPQAAHNALLRMAIESFAEGIWLLAPTEQRVRVIRLVQLRRQEASYEYDLVKTFTRHEDSDPASQTDLKAKALEQAGDQRDRALERCQRVIDRNSLTPKDASGSPASFRKMADEASAAAGMHGSFGQAMWQMASGMTHPSAMRALATSQLELVKPSQDGVLEALMTATFQELNIALLVALKLETTLIDMVRDGKLRPA